MLQISSHVAPSSNHRQGGRHGKITFSLRIELATFHMILIAH
jgi:hypothetical protein